MEPTKKKTKKKTVMPVAEEKVDMTPTVPFSELHTPVKKEKHKHQAFKKPDYYLTLFKVKDHTTWRAAMHSGAEAFDNEVRKNMTKLVITETIVYKIDRLTGDIKKI